MENLWMKSHQFILDCKVGDSYGVQENQVMVVRRTPKRIHFSNGETITITKSNYGFFYLKGKNVDQILRDIEGFFVYLIHSKQN